MEIRTYHSKDELELPLIVYKYRDWNNNHHKTIISKNELYFASPRDFEDPKDCKNLIDYSLLTDDQIYNKYYTNAAKDHPEWSETERHNCVKYWVKKGLLRNEVLIKSTIEEYNNIFFDCFGVLSTAIEYESLEMWNKYANNKTGFCIGLSTRDLVNTIENIAGGYIDYCEELPLIHPFENHLALYIKQIHSKEIKWKFEKEYRLRVRHESKMSLKERVINFNPDSIKYLIFGAKMKLKIRREIKKLATIKFKNIRFIQMVEIRALPIKSPPQYFYVEL